MSGKADTIARSAGLAGILWVLAATIFMTSMHAIVRYLGGQIPPIEMVFFRHAIGFCLLAPFILRPGSGAFRPTRIGLHVVRAGLTMAAMTAWFYGLAVVPLAEATALNFLATLFTGIGAVLVFGETMAARRWGAVAIGFAGALIVLRPSVVAVTTGALAVIASSALWEVSLLLLKALSRTDSPVTIVVLNYACVVAFSFGPSLLVWQWPTAEHLIWLTVMAAIGTCGHLAMAQAFKLTEATVLMPFEFTRLIWAAIVGYLAFAEIPDLWTWVGGAVIFLAGTYMALGERAPLR
ncbi:MAG: DMT family transporter [Pseudomonadota bacterium]